MKVWPLKFRELSSDDFFFADDSGLFFKAGREFLDRYANDRLSSDDQAFLLRNGHAFESDGDLRQIGFFGRWSERQHIGSPSAYIVLVPTLRCDLNCTYCQVSRAPLSARGFDWDEETLDQVIQYLDQLEVEQIKIEFQGGEPLLRLDLLESIVDFARKRFAVAEFVVCTNLQNIDARVLEFVSAKDVFVSTSLDGPREVHTRNRTAEAELTEMFHQNLETILSMFGQNKVSALPTIDPRNPPDPEDLIQSYEKYGFGSIFLRPINYQGFARKSHSTSRLSSQWGDYYRRFLRHLIDRNYRTGRVFEEFYIILCLKRILSAGRDGFFDLRNPNISDKKNVVIDYDGQIYPSDEARMLARVRRVDLSIGSVSDGLDYDKIALLAPGNMNNFDPDCIHCPYQAFCGTDPIDDLSRSGKVDVPRSESWFCQKHLELFDLAVELLYSNEAAVKYSLESWLGVPTLPKRLTPMLR